VASRLILQIAEPRAFAAGLIIVADVVRL